MQRVEEQDASWLGEEPLWRVASHIPAWLEIKACTDLATLERWHDRAVTTITVWDTVE